RFAPPTPEHVARCSISCEARASRSADGAEIDGASNRGIDSIKALTENVRYSPIKSRFRVYIIDEAHMVTREGFNALLKTLEEPPPHVKFIFATTAVEKFPETIVSRCQRYDFKRISLARIKSELARIAAEEKIELTDAALFAIAREGQGSMRDAESLLERMIAFSDRTIDDTKGADGSVLSDVPPDEIAEYKRQSALRELIDLQRLFRIARLGDEELAHSSVPRMVLEMTMVRLATADPVLPVDEVLARLDEIERG